MYQSAKKEFSSAIFKQKLRDNWREKHVKTIR